LYYSDYGANGSALSDHISGNENDRYQNGPVLNDPSLSGRIDSDAVMLSPEDNSDGVMENE
jgi:hypothetical protein